MKITPQEHHAIKSRVHQINGLPITITALKKQFHHRQVLHGLNITIAPGEFVAIVGRSGCGKSTLLRLLAGLETPNEGFIQFGNNASAQQRDAIRIMFQDARLLPWRTVIQNVAIGLEGNAKHIRDQAYTALSEVGLADRADDWPAQLSGGQRQRVALARALIHQPRLLLLDEPLGALDALTRLEMHKLIERIRHLHGFTTVLVTHDVGEAVSLADRVLLIEDGQVTLDQSIDLPYPREHRTTDFIALESTILKRLMSVEAINTRNQLKGRISGISISPVLSEIRISTAHGEISATLSTRELKRTPLEQGGDVLAIFKSTEVMLATTEKHI